MVIVPNLIRTSKQKEDFLFHKLTENAGMETFSTENGL